MSSCSLTASVTAIANALAGSMTAEEIALLGSVFSQLGDTLTTISLQRSLCEKK